MSNIKVLTAAFLLTACSTGVISGGAIAAAPAANAAEAKLTPEEKQYVARMRSLLDSLHPQAGNIAISPAKAALHLGKDYYFLPADEAKRVLTEGWGNPPDAVTNVLGMVFPAGKTFLDDGWGAVITYEATGYVGDEDAKTADYDALMKDMQASEQASNEELTKTGYAEQHLIGWAQPPAYDPVRHSLIWARDIRFEGRKVDTLNYDVRLLGRHGVLSLNMVSTMPHLNEIQAAATGFGKAASFDDGARYADYDPSMDKKAEFGLAGLVAAGAGVAVAKKLGLMGAILVFGKKFLVLILAGGAAAVAWIRRKMGLQQEQDEA